MQPVRILNFDLLKLSFYNLLYNLITPMARNQGTIYVLLLFTRVIHLLDLANA